MIIQMTELDWVNENRWKILKAIREISQPKNADISRETDIDRAWVSRNLDKLTELGLIDSNYRKEYTLTEKGESVTKHLQGVAEAMTP